MKQFNAMFIAFLMCLTTTSLIAQTGSITGTVKESSGGSIPGASVRVKGTKKGGVTDIDGKYSVQAVAGDALLISAVGYTTQEVVVGSTVVDVVLANDDQALNEVVVVGSRATQRSIIDSPIPVDILSAVDLKSTGQPSFDKALQYRVPSFNTVNTPVNDATTLLDPWELRNMGPSRSLILINGKRKNLSSLLYVQFSPGRGETGVDLSAIPQAAIKRVEILRDGASAQYGSDAIAGVMNIILKDKYDYTTLNINSGVTAKGDGGMYNVSLNSGSNLGGKGFVNYTLDLLQQNSAVRSGTIHVPTEIATFGGSPEADAMIKRYLTDDPTGGNINGTGETSAARFLINGGINLSDKQQLYANAAMVTKRVTSFANFRTPYWRQDRGLLHSPTDNGGINYVTDATLAFPNEDKAELYKGYIGYVPTFEGDLIDYNATLGAKGETNGWKHDVSLTTGFNSQRYTVDNTVNRSLGKSSPTRFKPGGFEFGHLVGNVDISKQVSSKVGLAFGMEARNEFYTIFAGDEASYDREGSNSFPGINKINAGTNKRFNIGGYADLSLDLTKDFLINGTVRAEKYSDFGPANVWKLSSRYKFADDKVVVRGSASTGFRAPSLHQVYAQSVQASFAGGTIVSSGLFNNRSAQARALGIPTLRPEKSTNYTFGIAVNPSKNFSVTVDYFTIGVKDRIVYSSSISTSDKNLASPVTELGRILKGTATGTGAELNSVQFFINGITTRNSGLDYVFSYRNIEAGEGKLSFNLAGNYMLENKIIGTPAEPAAISAAGASILNTQIKSLLTESRPKSKVIFGIDYSVKKFNVNVTNTYFGSTSFQDLDNGGGDMENIKATFSPGIVTDLSVGYSFTDKLSLTLNANNILNVIPKWDLVPLNAKGEAAIAKQADKDLLRGFLGFSGRYDILGYNGSQFSQLGTIFNANIAFKF